MFWAYNGAGNVTSQSDFGGDSTASFYDGGNMTEQVVYDVGHSPVTASWQFDQSGNVTQQIDLRGYTTLSTYDDGELVTQQVKMGASTVDNETFAYDDDGNVTSQLDNDGNVSSSTYDGEGRMIEQVVSNGGSPISTQLWSYDANGNVTEHVDQEGRTTLDYYDPMGNLYEEIDAAGTALSATTMYDHDPNGNLLSETDPGGNDTEFQYNAAGQVTWTMNAMGATATSQYDPDGQLTSEVDADGRMQTFTYDAMGHETSNGWFSSTTTASYETGSTFAYDPNGNLTMAANSYGTYTLDYDPLGQLTFVSEPIGLVSGTPEYVSLTMGYDGNGNRTLLEDSTGGTIESVFDADNDLVTESYTQAGTGYGMQVQQDYDWEGRVTEQRDYSDFAGTTLIATNDYYYNAEGSMTELDEASTVSTIADYTMAYDAAQELTQQIDHGNTSSFAYDALGELTTYGSTLYGTTTQNYDASGNRTSDSITVGNEMTYDGVYSYGYDNVGNETLKFDTTTSTTFAYTYDNQNHMTSATETVSGTMTMETDYSYDAFGNLTEEDVTTWSGMTPTVTGTKYVIDQWNPAKSGAIGLSGTDVIADLRASDASLISHYVWGDQVNEEFGRYDSVMAPEGTQGVYYTEADRQGSVRDIVNTSAIVLASAAYDAYGNDITVTSPYSAVADPQDYLGHYTYAGYDHDGATNYYFNNARVYDPSSGRWLSQDPLAFDAGDSNLYRYVNNRPTMATDPSGNFDQQQSPPDKIYRQIDVRGLGWMKEDDGVEECDRVEIKRQGTRRFIIPNPDSDLYTEITTSEGHAWLNRINDQKKMVANKDSNAIFVTYIGTRANQVEVAQVGYQTYEEAWDVGGKIVWKSPRETLTTRSGETTPITKDINHPELFLDGKVGPPQLQMIGIPGVVYLDAPTSCLYPVVFRVSYDYKPKEDVDFCGVKAEIVMTTYLIMKGETTPFFYCKWKTSSEIFDRKGVPRTLEKLASAALKAGIRYEWYDRGGLGAGPDWGKERGYVFPELRD